MQGLSICRRSSLHKILLMLLSLFLVWLWLQYSGNIHRFRAVIMQTQGKQITKIHVFRSSTEFWYEYHLCKPVDTSTVTDNYRRFISCPSTILDVRLSNNIDDLQGADAVLFNSAQEVEPDIEKNVLLLKTMSTEMSYSKQAWIFQVMEAPTYIHHTQPAVLDLPINTVMGYPPDSSPVRLAIGHYQSGDDPMPDTKSRTPQDWLAMKTHLVTWAVRNCKLTFWPRLEFVHELQKHVPIDIYGVCGNLVCLPRMSVECLDQMEKYKFYLALENTECDNYITEKFWNALIHGMVPIAYGPRKEVYTKVAPPNSFIYVGDYKSAEDLATYLVYLDKNPEEYLKYFEWRQSGKIMSQFIEHCALCHIPELVANISKGSNKRIPLSQSHYYGTCRLQDGKHNYEINTKLDKWSPWK